MTELESCCLESGLIVQMENIVPRNDDVNPSVPSHDSLMVAMTASEMNLIESSRHCMLTTQHLIPPHCHPSLFLTEFQKFCKHSSETMWMD